MAPDAARRGYRRSNRLPRVENSGQMTEVSTKMNTHSTRLGVVLRKIEYGESDLIFHLLTEQGRCSVFAKAAKKSKKRFIGASDTFATIRFCAGT